MAGSSSSPPTFVLPNDAVSFPHASWYSTQPLLAWVLNHHFYGKVHYVYASRHLLPYKAPNPKSSNPLEVFQDLYKPCFDRDAFDAFVPQKRINIRKGIEAVLTKSHPHYSTLIDVCDQGDIELFWPLLYIIDDSAATRGRAANSGTLGSDETLIANLAEHEFAVLVPDHHRPHLHAPTLRSLLDDSAPNALTTLAGLI